MSTILASRWARVAVGCLVPLLAAGVLVWSTSGRSDKVDRIPVAIVNDDQIITGSQPMAAGRALAAALTEPAHPSKNLQWTLTDDHDAQDGLRHGDYYAVLSIPKDFSSAILSSGTNQPVQGKLTLVSNAAASTTVPYISEQVASTAASSLGVQTTQGYLKNVYQGFNQIASSNQKSADSAASLADGADQLSSGAAQLDDGAGTLAGSLDQVREGAAALQQGTASVRRGADGVRAGAAGVAHGADGVHGGASALARSAQSLAVKSHDLAQGAGAVAAGTHRLARANTVLAKANRLLAADLSFLSDTCALGGARPGYCRRVERAQRRTELVAQLTAVVDKRSDALAGSSRRVASGAARLAGGNAELTQGARRLVGASADLDSGARRLSAGTTSVAHGAESVDAAAATLAGGTAQTASAGASLATGAAALSSSAGSVDHGAHQLSSGLAKGAEQSPTYSSSQQDTLAKTVSQPVLLSHSLQNDDHANGWLIAALVALVLWLAAMVTMLRRNAGASLAASGAPLSSRRLALVELLPLLGVTVLQAATVVVGLLVLQVDAANLVPFTLLTALAAVSFAAVAYAARLVLGRSGVAGLVVLLAVQLAALGNVVPLETAPAPLRALNAVLPVPAYVDGASQLLSGGSAGSPLAASLVLVAWGAVACLAAVLAVRRRRLLAPTTDLGLERMTGIEPA